MTQHTRRRFLNSSAVTLAATAIPWTGVPATSTFRSPNERPVIGFIGTGGRWNGIGPAALKFADCVAIADVDASHVDKAKTRVDSLQKKTGRSRQTDTYEDYRKLLDRTDLDAVVIATPDHWHTKISIDAMRSGRDVYCEKPLTLTIEEGKQTLAVLEETRRVFQVGTQQRSEMGLKFLTAVALIREGRIGRVQKATIAIGGSPTCAPIPIVDVPKGLNWDMWLGQAPMTAYRFRPTGRRGNTRCHGEFRFWYEYSGGKMTDWGAHHVDIACWGLDQLETGPVKVQPLHAKHPVEFQNGMPVDDTQYNTATEFHIRCTFPNDSVLDIRHNCQELGFDNGILFEGTKGRLFVNRGKLTGKAVDDMTDSPVPDEAIASLYKGKTPGSHMRNFFECLIDRTQPISDVASHHRAMTTCHLSNIAIRLGRTLEWNPVTESIVNDTEAAGFESRPQRNGYEINV